MDCFSDVEPCDVYDADRRRARRDHRCCECGGVIRKGETYEHVKMLYEGLWSTEKTCSDCLHLWCEVGCECKVHGMLGEAVYQSGDDRLIAMSKAIAASRREGVAKT